jgi:hypothetical protein
VIDTLVLWRKNKTNVIPPQYSAVIEGKQCIVYAIDHREQRWHYFINRGPVSIPYPNKEAAKEACETEARG